MRWSVTSSVAVRAADFAVTRFAPRRSPLMTPPTTPSRTGANEEVTSVPLRSTARASPVFSPRTSMRADSPVTVDGRLETTASSIWPGASGGVAPNHDALTFVDPDADPDPFAAFAALGQTPAAARSRAAATNPRRRPIREDSSPAHKIPLARRGYRVPQ